MATANQVIECFLSGKRKSSANTQTDGTTLYLFNNTIAQHREDGLYISNAGWFSKTTKERLNLLPNVSIRQVKGEWLLNGEQWDGNWIRVTEAAPPEVDTSKPSKSFITATKYVKTDGWRGYEEPIYAIAGANDTGGWSDSPCPSEVATRELNGLREALKGIPIKEVVCETSNVFCVHRYLIVPPSHIDNARAQVKDYLDINETRLLYAV